MRQRGFLATLVLLALLGTACSDGDGSNVAPPTTNAQNPTVPCPDSVVRRVDGGDPVADALSHIDGAVTDRAVAAEAFERDRDELEERYGATSVELAEGFGRAWTGDRGQEGVDYTVVDVEDFGILVTLPSQKGCPSGSALHLRSDAGLPLFFFASTQPG